LLLVNVAFVWVVREFLLPLFWAAVLAVVFYPLQQRWTAVMAGRTSVAALLTIASIVAIVIVPMVLVGFAVAREAIRLYQRVATGEIDLRAPMKWAAQGLPEVRQRMEQLGVDVERIQSTLSNAAMSISRFVAEHALTVGQNALHIAAMFFVMLYILFFFLRDAEEILNNVVRALPLDDKRERQLFARFAEVSRGTIKGTLVVGAVQGAIGGFMFWILGIPAPVLWGAIMVVASILPAVGAALIWVPAAVMLIVSGAIFKGIVLILVGTLIIGLIDNFLRPILVGRDTKMPDYLILVSTLGGLELFGITGFVLGPVIAALFLTVWEMLQDISTPDGPRSVRPPPVSPDAPRSVRPPAG
jgi:predicted PurR-regulated permease PerM